METAIVVVGVITIIYTYLGGMKAVIWTDLIQFIIKIAGAVLACVLGLAATVLSGEFRVGWEYLLIDIPRVHGRDRPDKVCVSFDGRDLTYGEMDRRSDRVARAASEPSPPRHSAVLRSSRSPGCTSR